MVRQLRAVAAYRRQIAETRRTRGPERSTFELRNHWKGEVLYGVAPVFAAIQARRREIYKLCMQDGLKTGKRKDQNVISRGIEQCVQNGIAREHHPKHDLNMMVPGQVHQGFLLDCSPLEFQELHQMPEVQQNNPYPIWLAMDEVHDPHNLGAMLRTAVFLGVDGVVVAKKNSAPLSPAVSKVSSGAMELFPVHASAHMVKLLENARQSGWDVIGSSLTEDAIPVSEMEIRAPTILIMGNEAEGLRYSVVRHCSRSVRILADERTCSPLLDSLNVSVAAGILLGQLTSSRRQK